MSLRKEDIKLCDVLALKLRDGSTLEFVVTGLGEHECFTTFGPVPYAALTTATRKVLDHKETKR